MPLDPAARSRMQRYDERHDPLRPRACLPPQVRVVADWFHDCMLQQEHYGADAVEQECALWSALLCAAVRWHRDYRLEHEAPPVIAGMNDMLASFLLYQPLGRKTRSRRLENAGWLCVGGNTVEYDAEFVHAEYYYSWAEKYPDADEAKLQRSKFDRGAFPKFDTWHFSAWVSGMIEHELRRRIGACPVETRVLSCR